MITGGPDSRHARAIGMMRDLGISQLVWAA